MTELLISTSSQPQADHCHFSTHLRQKKTRSRLPALRQAQDLQSRAEEHFQTVLAACGAFFSAAVISRPFSAVILRQRVVIISFTLGKKKCGKRGGSCVAPGARRRISRVGALQGYSTTFLTNEGHGNEMRSTLAGKQQGMHGLDLPTGKVNHALILRSCPSCRNQLACACCLRGGAVPQNLGHSCGQARIPNKCLVSFLGELPKRP